MRRLLREKREHSEGVKPEVGENSVNNKRPMAAALVLLALLALTAVSFQVKDSSARYVSTKDATVTAYIANPGSEYNFSYEFGNRGPVQSSGAENDTTRIDFTYGRRDAEGNEINRSNTDMKLQTTLKIFLQKDSKYKKNDGDALYCVVIPAQWPLGATYPNSSGGYTQYPSSNRSDWEDLLTRLSEGEDEVLVNEVPISIDPLDIYMLYIGYEYEGSVSQQESRLKLRLEFTTTQQGENSAYTVTKNEYIDIKACPRPAE